MNFKTETTESQLFINMAAKLAITENVVNTCVSFITGKNIPLNIFAFRLILYEGLSNAIKHGSHLNPEKNIKLELNINDRKIEISIEDSGEGFDWHSLPSRVVDETKPFGRGTLLMKAYGYNPTFNKKGNILYLSKEF